MTHWGDSIRRSDDRVDPNIESLDPTRKAAVVLELLRAADVVEPARRHGLSQAQLFVWRDRFLEGGQAALRIRRGQIELE